MHNYGMGSGISGVEKENVYKHRRMKHHNRKRREDSGFISKMKKGFMGIRNKRKESEENY